MKIINKEVNIDADYLNLSFFGEIDNLELKKLIQLKKLRHLNVSSSDLFDEHLDVIIQIENLELLDLDSTEITDKGLQQLSQLKKLKELRLKDNPQLTDNCIEFLSNIKHLEFLHIGNTSITTSGLRTLLDNKKMKSIILDFEFENEIDELKRLTQKCPNLEITLKGTGIISNGMLNE
jgi:hypothetical protein